MLKEKTVCGVTAPVESGYIDETMKILKKWGADAIRDCDGTSIPKEIMDAGFKVYSTYFVARGDNEFAKQHNDERTHFYLLSDRFLACDKCLEMPFLNGFLTEQILPDYDYSPKEWWEVIDRTCGEVVADYDVDEKNNIVTIKNPKKFHEYTVTFLAKAIWDSTQMYNYITNKWTKEKDLPFDAGFPNANAYVVERLKKWLIENPQTDIVRFTTFFYHFTLIFNSNKKEKYVDWFGYSGSVSPCQLKGFEKEYGYKLRPEDIVDEGYYNSIFRIPTKRYLDYMEYIQKFVSKNAKRLVDEVHKQKKEAMMFLGDNWIGTEPYGDYFKDIGLDAVVGSVGGGVTVRILSDIPNIKYSEGRFLPYFFPDTFYDGGNPTKELNANWLTARRAIMRKPIDRIGYGGYLSLAGKFPDFIDRVSEITSEFRNLYEVVKNNKPYNAVKVAVLNSWGKIRSWQCYMVAHELWYKQIYSYQGILESLSGLAVDTHFINFDDIKNGALKNFDVVINAGAGNTAFSGGDVWKDEEIVSIINEWVYNGGGFIGVGEPSAVNFQGKYFQLASVLGVDKEQSFSLSVDKYNVDKVSSHFILEDVNSPINYGEDVKNIYALENTKVLDIALDSQITRKVNVGEVKMSVNEFGRGRAFYITGLPFDMQNSRLLYRATLYVAGKEDSLKKWFSSNIYTECNYYESENKVAVINNSDRVQETTYYDGQGKGRVITLSPMEILWLKAN